MPRGGSKKKLICKRGHTPDLTGRATNGSCLLCLRQRSNEWYNKNKEQAIKRALNRRRENPEKAKKINFLAKLKYQYKLTFEDYQQLVMQQNNLCAICKKPETCKGRRLNIDHSHFTGKVRGLLCNNCNNKLIYILEYFPELIEKGKEYLARYS